MKIRRILLSLLVVTAVVVASSPARVAATPNPPHGYPTPYNRGSCTVLFVHGNFLGAAYARFKIVSYNELPSVCASTTSVQVTGWNGFTQLPGNVCAKNICSPDADGWYHSTRPNSTILGTNLRLCSTAGDGCRLFQLSGI